MSTSTVTRSVWQRQFSPTFGNFSLERGCASKHSIGWWACHSKKKGRIYKLESWKHNLLHPSGLKTSALREG